MLHNSAPTTARQTELKRILIFIGITLAINFADRFFLSSLVNALYHSFNNVTAILLISYTRLFLVCCASVYLYRRFVFKSSKPMFSAVLILFGMQFVRSLLLNALVSVMSWRLYDTISPLMYYGVLALFYLIARNRLYLDTSSSDKVLSASSEASADGDPSILSVDLEDINRRKQRQQLNRITGKSNMDTSARKPGISLVRRLNLDNDDDRVIAQSSRDAIRVMEHKALNMKHEWNCDDHNGQQPDSTPERVIAKGSNAIHVTEHSSLNMKHEWNCDDHNGQQPDSTPERVIAKGSNAIHVAEHSSLDMKHEWNCNDRGAS